MRTVTKPSYQRHENRLEGVMKSEEFDHGHSPLNIVTLLLYDKSNTDVSIIGASLIGAFFIFAQISIPNVASITL